MATRVQTLPVPVSTTCVYARRRAQQEEGLLCHVILSLLTKPDLCPGYTRAGSPGVSMRCICVYKELQTSVFTNAEGGLSLKSLHNIPFNET